LARWEREGIPHKGWKEIGIEDLGEDLEFGDDVEYEQCEMCGQEKIRYVHVLQHSDFNGELRVGCVCAEHMTDDYINGCTVAVVSLYCNRKNHTAAG